MNELSLNRTPLVVGALFATFVALAPIAQTADLPTFVDVPGGLIIGAHSEGKWLSSEEAGKALGPGRKYRLFKLTGEFGDATGGKSAPNADVCPDIWEQELTPATENRAIAVAAPWNPMPRTARANDKTQEVYVKAARDFLLTKGIRNPVVKITQLLRVDLDGDGEDEVLLSATNYPGRAGESPLSAVSGNYSFVLLRHVVNGKVQTKLIDGEFYPKANGFNAPNRYEVLGLLDLDGDGRLEIILQSAYYEGGGTSVWRFGSGKIERVLQIECGA